MGIREELAQFIDSLSVISTHEHHESDEFQAGLTLEKMLRGSYVGWCGVPEVESARDRDAFLAKVRHNTYFVWLEKALGRLYGIERLTAGNWDELSAEISAAHRDPDWHMRILREHCRYLAEVQDTYVSPGSDRGHPDLFKPTLRIDMFLVAFHPESRDHNGNNAMVKFNTRPGDLGAYVEFVRDRIAAARQGGCVALKTASAYERPIRFTPATPDAARMVFGKRPDELTSAQRHLFGDYVLDRILELCAELDLPIQVHTGLGQLGGSSPINFLETIIRHPRTRFDIFHGGYPWTSEVGAIAHNHKNVWPDLVWLPLISTSAAVRALDEWLDVVPSCEQILWGADTWTSEESLGAVMAARHVITDVLTRRIQSGLTDMDGARDLAVKILRTNAGKLFGI